MEVIDVLKCEMRSFEAIFLTLTSSVGLDDMVQCPDLGRAESWKYENTAPPLKNKY